MQKIMFNDRYALTQAVIEGRKTMARRIEGGAQFQDMAASAGEIFYNEDTNCIDMQYEGIDIFYHVPRCRVGEIVAMAQSYEDVFYKYGCGLPIDDDPQCGGPGFKNKMFVKAEYMPHQIRIMKVRVERLQDISDEDCIKEGIRFIPEINKFYFEDVRREEGFYRGNPREAFASLIDKVSGRGTWERNPWVVVYKFELVK